MLLNLSDDQEFFRETTERFLTEQVPPDALRALRDDPTGFDPAYWRRGAELGWTSLLVSEEHGGGTISGAGLVDLGLVAYEFGRHAAPGPLAGGQRGRRDPERARRRARRAGRPALRGGHRHLVRARRSARRRWRADRARPAATGTDLVLRGEARPVESAGQADHLLVTCRDERTASTQVLVPAATPGVTVGADADGRPDPALRHRDLRRRATVPATRSSGTPARPRADVDRQFQLLIVLLNAESVGAMQAAFDMTVEWAFDRYSFGRPLASYQALKHRFADMFMWLEASHAISDAACAAVGDGRRRRGRAGERGQGVHRPVRRRARAGLRADARRHRRHVRARPPPVPAPRHRRTARSPARRPTTASASRHCSTRGTGRRHERVAGRASGGASEVEDLESFRQRARAFIRANLRQVTPEELRWDATAPTRRRSWPPSPATGSSSACCSTPAWPASASRAPTAARA